MNWAVFWIVSFILGVFCGLCFEMKAKIILFSAVMGGLWAVIADWIGLI